VPIRFAPYVQEAVDAFQRVPGSAVLIRYVRSSYQNDPIRSAIELVLVIFFIRYLLAPSYSTSKQNFIQLSDDVSDHDPMEGVALFLSRWPAARNSALCRRGLIVSLGMSGDR
jgi:hypothetical protein